MNIVTCIILEDEPLARNILEEYIKMSDHLHLSGICKNATEAFDFLKNTKVDLIFCDIKMPGINGLQFLNSLTQRPKVIITSAYREYAIEGFQIGVVDYLLKPFSFERFTLAVNRTTGNGNISSAHPKEKTVIDFLFFKVGKSIEKVFLEQICYVLAYGNYCKLILNNTSKPLIVNSKISDLEHQLDEKKFIRIHKYYIINILYIFKVTTNLVTVKGVSLPISKSYKKKFLKNISKVNN